MLLLRGLLLALLCASPHAQSESASGSPSGSPSTSGSPSVTLSLSVSALSSPSPSDSLAPSASTSTSPSPSASLASSSPVSSPSPSASLDSGSVAPSATSSSSPSLTHSPSVSRCGSVSRSPLVSPSPSPCGTGSLSLSVSPSLSGSPTQSRSASGCVSGTHSPSRSASSTPSPSATLCGTVTVSGTASPSDSVSASGCTSGTRSPSGSLSPSLSASSTLSSSPSLCLTATISGTASPSDSVSASGCASGTLSPSRSASSTHSPSPSLCLTATITGSLSTSGSQTTSVSETVSKCNTHTRSQTVSTSSTVSQTSSGRATLSGCATASETASGSFSGSACSTVSRSSSVSGSPSVSVSPSVTVSATHSGSPTVSVSGTHTAKWFGYLPPIAILDAVTGENVTFGWLDWRRDYLIVVYAGLKFEFMQTVLDAPPPSAQLFQPPPGVWAPVITDAIEVTPNYLVYSMPFTPANSAPGAVSMTLAAGVLRRSDTTYSRPRQFSIAFGFVPTVSFTNGWSTDSEDSGGGAAWFGGEANATVDMVLSAPSAVLMANTNASQWAAAGKFYVGDTLPEAQRLPGGLPLLAYNFTSNSTLGNALVLSLNVSRLAPGQYPVTIAGGVLQDLAPNPASLTGAPTLHGNIRVTGWLKVGPVPSWRVLDASSGRECGGEPLDPERPLALAFEVAGAPEVVAGLAAVAGAGAGAGAAGGARAVPAWGALVDAATAAALPLPPAQLPYSVHTSAGASLSLLYSLAPLAPLAPGNYTPVSAFATGALCNGLPGRALLCTAHETMGGADAATPLLRIGARPTAALYNGAQTNRYGGALNALGTAPATPADAPVPTLASSLALTFTGAGMPQDLSAGEAARACAWGTAVVAPAGLPPPDALSYAAGVLAYTWAAVNDTTIPSGVYDVMLRAGVLSSASGVPNARAYVRLVVGLALEFWTPDTSIGSGGGDSANGARLAVRSAGAAAAAAAAAGWPAKLTASGAPYVTANTDALLRVRGTPSALPYEQMLLEVLSYSAPPGGGGGGGGGGAAQLVPSPIARSALSQLAAPPLQAYTATADAARVDYLLSLGGLPDGTYLFTLRNDASGASGMASDGTSLAQTVSITDFYGQPIGTRNCSVTLVIVRTPFTAVAYAPGAAGGGAVALNATLPVGVPLPHPGLPLPASLFVPSPLLPAATIATSISGAELDTRGLALASAPAGLLGSASASASAPLSTAALVSSPGAVLGASGTLNLTLTATAETGDVAQAFLLLPLTHRPSATLYAVDSRGRSNSSVLVVKPSSGAGTPALALALFLELAFDAPVSVPSVRSAAVQCTVQAGAPLAAACGTLTVGAPEVTVRAPGGAPGALRFRFPLALGAGDLLPIVDAPLLGLLLGVDTRGMASAADARARAHAPPPVVVRLDAHAPKVAKSLIPNDDDPRGLDNLLPARYIPPFLPVVGVPYHATLPYHMYSDAFTAPEAGGVTILGNAQPWVAHYGLVLTPGPLGRAAVEGTAAATLPPPHQSTFFSVIVEDTAGNSYTGASDLQLPILPPHPVAGSPVLRLSSTAPLRAVERGAASLPVFLDPLIDIEPGRAASGAASTLAAPIALVRVTLTGLETNASFLFAQQEQLEGANPCPESCVLSWGIDVSTGAGELQLAPRLARRDPWAGLDELAAGNLTLAAARNFLRTVRYVNTRVRMGSLETRVLRVQVMARYYDRPLRPLPDGTGPAVPGYADGVIASAVRTLEVGAVNDAPVIGAPGGALAAGDASGTGACVGGAWGWPPGAPPAPVFPLRALLNATGSSEWGPPSVTDVDDALLTRAEVALAVAGGRGGFTAGVPAGAPYGACDPARDALFLPSAYRLAGALPPLLQGVYTPATCSLQLSPLPPALALPIADFVEALRAVAFTSLDPANPTAWDLSGSAPSRTRALRVTVTDGGSGGLLAPAASAPLVLPVTLTPTPANFTRSLRAIFGARPAGILSSTDLYAARKAYADARGVVYAAKWPLVLPGASDAAGATPGLRTLTSPHSNCTIASPAAVVCTIALDLTPVAGARGRWAGGAIASANAPALPAAPAPTVELLVGGSRAGGELVGATAVPLGEAAAGASAGALNHAFAPPSAGVPASSFSYSAASPSTLTLALARAPPEGALGEYVLQLTIGAGLAQQFAVDLRRAACALSDSPAYVGDAALRGGTAYPDNSLCTYAPTAVGAGGGVVTRGDYAASAAALASGEAAMAAAGAAPAAIARALVAARNAARGQARLTIPPGALPPGATLAITAVNLPKALLPLLPPAPPVPTSPTPPAIDAPTALLLGPPGTAFAPPFTLCVYVGDLPPTSYGALVFSSQVSARDAAKGFTPFALGANGSYSAVTGEVCAQGAHFSIAAVLLLGAPPPVYAPREVRASAMCPSGARSGGGGDDGASASASGTPVPGTWTCSGNGACVGAGVCACFAGWTGGDCSLRVCPGGESWGQGSFSRDARAAPAAATTPRHAPQDLLLVHGYEECSGRGACDRASGVCACHSGYEGAACSRMACPRAPAASLAFAHIDHSLGREAAEAEMAWEAVYGGEGEGGGGEGSGGSGGGGGGGGSGGNGTSAASLSQGFSTGVLSRSEEPCSGRGRCLLLRDLPDYAAGAGAGGRERDWAAARVQRCVCDEGWSGPDCSQRTCPFGVNTEAYANAANAPACAADVEAVAADGAGGGGDSWAGSRPLVASRAVTVLTLTLALPLPPDASGAHYVEAGSDDVVLSVCGSGARRTAAAGGVWGGSAAAASALAAALLAAPCMRGAALSVAPPAAPTSATTQAVQYTVTFTALPPGAVAGGGGALRALPLACAAPVLPGCAGPGCQPVYSQLRAWRAPPTPPAWLAVASSSGLRSPPLPPSPPPAAWGVTATLVLERLPGTPTALFHWEAVSAYGGGALSVGGAEALGSGAYEGQPTPLPPGALRQALAGPFGLRLNISEAEDMQVLDDLQVAYGAPGAGWRLVYSWTLPTCSVAVVQRPTEALTPSECSSRGLCSRDTGACACFLGYQGAACERSAETAMV